MSRLIVNADDYAYSEGVSRGILHAARDGIVTATGILSNSPHFASHARWLNGISTLDVGVHLNLTFGTPVTEGMKATLRGLRHGCEDFCEDKFWTAIAILSGKLPLRVIEAEWDAQIRLCIDSRLPVQFLNSHEHLHALPSLFRLTRALAERNGVTHIRIPYAEWMVPLSTGSILRNAILQTMAFRIPADVKEKSPELLGIACSGKLNETYLFNRLTRLRPGKAYELMCHPGYFQPAEMTDKRLMAYHDWQGELDALCSPAVIEFLRTRKIELIGFRNLGNCGPIK
jgi:hypothetical protein